MNLQKLLAIAMFCPLVALADSRIRLPDGTECWMNNVGHVYGCSGGPQAQAAPAQPSCKWVTQKQWEGCERRKSMPGQPSNCNHLLPNC